MRYAVLADVHGNLEALEAVLAAVKGVDDYLLLGDTVGYGADPEACLSALRRLGPIAIAGNHDKAVTDDIDLELFSGELLNNLMWSKKQISTENMMFLREMPQYLSKGQFEMVHGSLRQPLTEYIDDIQSGLISIEMMKKKILFVGHLHIPLIVYKDASGKFDGWQVWEGVVTDLSKYEKAIINAGAVGQPRDGDPRASYGIFDEENRTFELKRVKYDINKTQEKMKKAGISGMYIDRLTYGR
jgi:predicted phosphodiesterase